MAGMRLPRLGTVMAISCRTNLSKNERTVLSEADKCLRSYPINSKHDVVGPAHTDKPVAPRTAAVLVDEYGTTDIDGVTEAHKAEVRGVCRGAVDQQGPSAAPATRCPVRDIDASGVVLVRVV